ncbi:MAG: O-antigen ligase family protein [Pirellulaceae bacterium]
MLTTIATPSTGLRLEPAADARPLSLLDRGALALGIFEIPLQIDKYFLFHERDAQLGAVGGINVSITTCCLVVVYIAWFAEAAVQRLRVRAPVIVGVPMVAYLATVLLSCLVAMLPLLAVCDLVVLLQAYALFFYVANRVQARDDILFCIVVLAGTLLFQSGLICGLTLLGDRAAGQEFHFGPLVLAVWMDGRPAGSMHSAVVAGSLMALIWMPSMAATFIMRPGRIRSFVVVATGAGLLAILLTQTRGAILTILSGSLLFGAAMLIRGWLPRSTIYLVLVLAVIGIYPLYRVVEKRVHGDDDGSAESRKHLAAIAAEMIEDHPLFGYGAGNCHLAGERYANQGKFRSEWYYTVHCKYLLVWIETGIAGLVTFLAVLGNGLRHGWSAWTRRDRSWAPLGLGLVGALAGHMVHMSVDIFNSRTQVQMLWLVLGLAAAVWRASHRIEPTWGTSIKEAAHVT